jgi:glycosyltransferase involved in cell wall biosynthesis
VSRKKIGNLIMPVVLKYRVETTKNQIKNHYRDSDGKVSMIKLSIIIPSRKQEKQIFFIQRAVDSVRRQSIANQFAITFLVGVDKGCILDSAISNILGIQCIESDGVSQAKALNAAIRQVHEGYVAFLEDDDQWMPNYLNSAMQAIAFCDFVSSTQSEFNESDEFIRVNDFPTPSGWFMPSSTLIKVGEFNESYKFHIDNEWLGRLSESNLKRIHMVEATAPIHQNYIQVRPWLANIINLSGGTCNLDRHNSPYPLVIRNLHSNSGMAQIATNSQYFEISKNEKESLIKRFGKIPW